MELRSSERLGGMEVNRDLQTDCFAGIIVTADTRFFQSHVHSCQNRGTLRGENPEGKMLTGMACGEKHDLHFALSPECFPDPNGDAEQAKQE